MPFCPECNYEYRLEITRCPDCGTELVEELPKELVPEVHWVRLHSLPGVIYAEMVKEVLDREEIPNLLLKDFYSSAYGAAGAGLPGMEAVLLVPEEHAERAAAILHQMLDHI